MGVDGGGRGSQGGRGSPGSQRPTVALTSNHPAGTARYLAQSAQRQRNCEPDFGASFVEGRLSSLEVSGTESSSGFTGWGRLPCALCWPPGLHSQWPWAHFLAFAPVSAAPAPTSASCV